MSLYLDVEEPWTTAYVNGQPVVTRQCLRPREEPAVRVSVTVDLSIQDVAAVLASCADPRDLADDAYLWELVAGSVLNSGCLQIEEDRVDAENARGQDAEHVAFCQERAAAVFGGPDPDPAGLPPAQRRLVGSGAGPAH